MDFVKNLIYRILKIHSYHDMTYIAILESNFNIVNKMRRKNLIKCMNELFIPPFPPFFF